MLQEKDEYEILKYQILYDDEESFKKFFISSFPPLVRFAYAYVKSKEVAEEIASDVLLNIWQRRKNLDKINNLKLYLYISAKNAALNYLKKEKHSSTADLDSSSIWLKADDTTPEQLAISKETFQKIRAAIAALPPRCQMIYKLVKEDGLKYKDVAAILNLSVKTVEAQMGAAFRKLSEAVKLM
jgi:RNA polymerase sigma-70 factor (ECF subfamily)